MLDDGILIEQYVVVSDHGPRQLRSPLKPCRDELCSLVLLTQQPQQLPCEVLIGDDPTPPAITQDVTSPIIWCC